MRSRTASACQSQCLRLASLPVPCCFRRQMLVICTRERSWQTRRGCRWIVVSRAPGPGSRTFTTGFIPPRICWQRRGNSRFFHRSPLTPNAGRKARIITSTGSTAPSPTRTPSTRYWNAPKSRRELVSAALRNQKAPSLEWTSLGRSCCHLRSYERDCAGRTAGRGSGIRTPASS